MAQKIELEKIRHNWNMEAMEKQMGDSNAKEWMQMIGSTGEKLIGPLINTAGAIVANKMMAKQEAQAAQLQLVQQVADPRVGQAVRKVEQVTEQKDV